MPKKAVNLLYFVVKKHSFHDGNKQIAASLFFYFLIRIGYFFVMAQRLSVMMRSLSPRS
ncbi:MAG: Fic family protein [Eggerthella sp.]|nr:Fic family protein [Eggerthella sp.]